MTRSHGVIVCGGGLTGVAAAVGAARMGTSVLLIERYGFLGGMATNGLVQPFMTYRAGGKQIICGIFQEILERLKKKNALKDGHIFDSEVMKLILDELVLESNVNLLLHTFVANVEVKGNSLTGIYVENKSGREKIEAKVFVDATGDGDIAARSGTPFDKGRRKDKLMQPMTLSFRMGNVNRSKMPDRNTINEIYLRAKERGEISNPREDVLWFNTPRDEVIHFNTTRVIKRDSTDADDLTAAEIEGRKQVWKMVNFLKNHVLGFENSYLLMIAPQIGPRESRR
ncbi:MAG: FAD-dependent oxidoreductase, partial [Clostridia bacterium]|nr:FAD-dependent oxidoreductase [Clostridia bacterium]